MSISALGGQTGQSSTQNLLLSDLKKNGLSSDVATQVDSEIKSIFEQQSSSSGGTRPNPTDIRAAIEQKLKDDVGSGSLTQDQADSVLKALDQFDQQIKESHGGDHGGQGGEAPDPAKLFSKLDSNGDGKLTKDEFVSGRPDNVSEDQAGKLYDQIAAKSGSTDTSGGLSQDQFATGFQAAAPQGGPAGGGGAPPAGGGGGRSDSSSGSSTEVKDVQVTTSADGTKTTVTTYADGSKSTSVTYGKATDSSAETLQNILKALTQGKSNSADTASYLNNLLSGSLIDTKA